MPGRAEAVSELTGDVRDVEQLHEGILLGTPEFVRRFRCCGDGGTGDHERGGHDEPV
ncbi:hypothetical protein GCM10009836_42060 [Pseudonocardia ailaonensis]|uniref:Uncharacterized protein n=1 Tax=Pseudonocardia ailaonensis TaxID=367279 RepID=A0ABN2NBJ6_9PSEU